jgi:hypothetical protein
MQIESDRLCARRFADLIALNSFGKDAAQLAGLGRDVDIVQAAAGAAVNRFERRAFQFVKIDDVVRAFVAGQVEFAHETGFDFGFSVVGSGALFLRFLQVFLNFGWIGRFVSRLRNSCNQNRRSERDRYQFHF